MQLTTRREFIQRMGAGTAAMALSSVARPAAAEPSAMPNVVVFYFDDLDFDEIGAYGSSAFPSYTGARERGVLPGSVNPWLAYFDSPAIHTPNIDGLARDGARFDRFYVTTSICTPSRYGLLTGRYACRSAGVCAEYPPGGPVNIVQNAELGPDEQSIGKLMQAQGYKTGIVGKWHNSAWDGPYAGRVSGVAPDADPRDPDVARNIRDVYERGVAYVRDAHGFDYAGRMYLQNKEALGIPKALQVHNLEWIVEGALEFIDAHRDEPFYLHFASPAPHGWIGSGDFLNADPLATPAGMLDAPPKGMPPREDAARRAKEAGVAARLIEATWLDDAIGAVLDRLEAHGIAGNTLVLFISDHQNRGKETLYEATHVPALVRWPERIPPGARVDAICANIDVVPTVLEACGADAGALATPLDGRSFLPLVTGSAGARETREALLLEVGYARAVVAGDWKYIALRYPPALQERIDQAEPKTYSWDGTAKRIKEATRWDAVGEVSTPYGAHKDFPAYFERDQLYNLREDPYEQTNRANDPACAEKLNEMRARMSALSAGLPHSFGEFAPGREGA